MNHCQSASKFVTVRCLTSILIVAGMTLLSASSVSAQRRGGGWDPEAYVKGLDSNKNGKLDPSEVSGRTEGFLKNLGFETGSAIQLDAIVEKVREDRGGDRRGGRRERENDDEKTQKVSKVPTLGAVHDPVPSFGASSETGLDTIFTDDVIRQVNDTLKRYDRNRDNLLDEEELKRGRWGQPRPEESDTNGDGKLSRIELSNRYRARELFENDNEENNDRRQDNGDNNQNDRSRSRNEPNNRDRGQFGNRGSSTRSSTRSSSARTSSRSGYKISADDKEARFASYADSLIKQYDSNKDGSLNEAEFGAMSRPPKNADSDKDGNVTKEELLAALSGGDASSNDKTTEKPARDRAKSSGSDRSSRVGSSRSRSSGSLGGLDINENNQVEMHEFSADWDEDTLAEFYEKDKNGDGVITLKEWSEK